MRQLAAGSLVKHRKLGTGKVVAVEPLALHVFFPGSDSRYAAKLRWPDAGNFLSQDELAPDPWLEGLTSFALDTVSGRYALAANFLSQEDAVEAFLAENDGAFRDAPARKGALRLDRGARWRAAGAEWTALLGDGRSAKLLEDGEFGDLAKRLRFDRFPRPDAFRRHYVVAGAVAGIVGIGVWFLFTTALGRRQYLPGPVSQSHATFGDRCEKCHVKFGVTSLSPEMALIKGHDLRLCYECHGALDFENKLIAKYPGNQLCLRCHKDLKI